MTDSAATLFATSPMSGAATAALIGGGLALIFGTIVQVVLRLRNRPADVDPRDAIGVGGVILRLLLGLWLAVGGLAWRIYAETSPAETAPSSVVSPAETAPSSAPSDPSGTDQ
jgi:hypothetical protein